MLNNKRWLTVIVLSFAISLVFCSSAAKPAELPKSVGIATHPKGALLNILGSGFAKVISAHLPIEATDRPYTGYMAWLPLLNRGEVDMGVVTCTDCYYSYHGLKPYKEKLRDLRVLSSGSAIRLGYVVRADSGVKTLAALKGKRVCIDIASVSTRLDQETVLKAAGLDLKKDITVVYTAGVTEPVYAVTEGRSDATWASVGMGAVKELIAKVGGIYWVPLCDSPDSPRAKMLLDVSPGISYVHIKAGKAPTVENDTWLMSKPIYLATYKGFSEQAAYQITKTIWQNYAELAAIHPMLKGWTHKAMVSQDVVIPYHPGAIHFYKEVGAWSDKMEQAQQKLLSK